MCNMSGFNSYPGTPLTLGRGNQSRVSLCFVWLVLVVTLGSVTAPDGSCDHCVLVTTLAWGPRGAAAVLTSVYAVYTARPVLLLVNYAIKRLPPPRHSPGPRHSYRSQPGWHSEWAKQLQAKDQEARKDNWSNLILGPNQRVLHKLWNASYPLVAFGINYYF